MSGARPRAHDEAVIPILPARLLKRDGLVAAAVLTLLLIVAFAPVVFGQRNLMLSAWDAPSVMSTGAYDPVPRPAGPRVARTADPGAPAWTIEPWFKLIAEQYWGEYNVPLWNPDNAFGAPLLASAQPQPLFPLAALLSAHVTAWTFSLFILARLLLGGLLTYFFARRFLASLPSLFAAISFMFSGYFIIYLNMPHLSVEVFTPGVLLAFEILARRNSWGAVAGVAATIFLLSTGGMPESMFLIVSFGCLYFVCRLTFAAELRARAASLLVRFLAAVLLGFGLSAFVLMPFAEFALLGFDAHQAANLRGTRMGLGFDPDFPSVIQYLLPLIFGPPLASIFQHFFGWSGLRGYWGVLPFFFAVAAVLFGCLRRRSVIKDELFLVAFFSITLALMVLKRFGSPVINWIGALPLSELVVYQKYLGPLIALCIAMLAGIGFSVLIERRGNVRLFLLAGGVVLLAMLATGGSYLPTVLALDLKGARLFYFTSMALGVCLVIGLTLCAVLAQRISITFSPWLACGLVGLLSAELLSTFIVPCFYLIGSFPPARADPYAGAPYVGLIRGLNTGHARIFAREGLLYPNWSAAFGLGDVRSLDAIYYARYLRFVQNFLLAPGQAGAENELSDRFTGTGFAYDFKSEPERRFLALSSIRYLITHSEYGSHDEPASDFKKIYAGEALVYEVPNVLPRAALFRAVEILPDDAVLARLKDPAFNPSAAALISRESIAAESAFAALAEATPRAPTAARILQYGSQHVIIEADAPGPALLVLNDTNYPGWLAYVNGRPAEMLTANFLFRGVIVPPGKSTVEFKYQPASFRIGGGVSAAALAMLVILVWRERSRTRALKPLPAWWRGR